MAGKQAKRLSQKQIKTALAYLATTRHPARNRVMFLLSCKAGLRAKEIAGVTWAMLTDAEGQMVDDLHLTHQVSKGKKGQGGRSIPLCKALKEALLSLGVPERLHQTIIRSERNDSMSATTVTNWFQRLYRELGFDGCSSHSGRRTFGTNAARLISSAGGSLREVQEMLGHNDLRTTQAYIDSSEGAKRRVIDMI